MAAVQGLKLQQGRTWRKRGSMIPDDHFDFSGYTRFEVTRLTRRCGVFIAVLMATNQDRGYMWPERIHDVKMGGGRRNARLLTLIGDEYAALDDSTEEVHF